MKKDTKEGVTLDDLAVMVAKRFDGVEKNLGERIDGLEGSLNARIDALDKKLDYKFEGLSRRIDDLALTKVTWEAHNILVDKVAKFSK